MFLEAKNQAQCGVYGTEFVEPKVPDVLAEPAWINRARLLDQNTRFRSGNPDAWAEGCSSCRG